MKRNLIIIAVLLGSLVLCSCTNSAQDNSNISSGSSADENSLIAESYTVTEMGYMIEQSCRSLNIPPWRNLIQIS